jgi:tellurium resistance protein TerD
MHMSVSLSKGGNVSLSKEEPGLTHILIGLGWDTRTTDGTDFDLDASAFLLGASERVRGDDDFIFYNNLRSSDGSVEHTGDNRTGEGEGDDEALKVELGKVPVDIQKVAVTVTIHDGEARRQSFGMVSNAFIRVVNDVTGREIARYDLSEDASTETAMIFGEIYRHNGEWKFRAVGQGYKGGLAPLARNFGVNIG